MEVRANLASSLEFLQWFRPGGPWVLTAIPNDQRKIETRTFTAANVGEEGEITEWLANLTKEKWNVYFHVNPTRTPMTKKAEASDIAALEWLHVDMDPEPGQSIEDERERILGAILDKDNGMPPPSCVLFSGGGYWGFWRLKEPLPITDPEDAKLYNLQVELLLGGDGCHNIDRIARLPGTINWPNRRKIEKGQLPTVAQVVEQNDDVAYDLAEFTKAAVRQDMVSEAGGGTEATQVKVSGNVARIMDLDEELPDAVHARTKVVIVQGHDPDKPLAGKDQSRSAWLHMVCCSLVRAEVPDEVIYSIITDPDFRISDSVLDKGNSNQVHRYAIRQIKQAKESVIAPELCELNSQYALIESVGGRCRVAREGFNHSLGRHEVEFLLIDGFRATYGNRYLLVGTGRTDANGNVIEKPVPMGKWWLEHPDRRTYSDVIFYPGRDFDRSLNLWRGFAHDALPGECSLYLDHIRKVLCRGNDEWADYLIRWMAYAIQNPHEPGHVAVVLRGKQGTGKGTFAQHFGALWGVHFKHITKSDHLTGQFNQLLMDASVVFADECFRTSKSHASALKTLITEDTLRVEAKGVDNLETRNCVHLIMATNEAWAVNAELDDRRFFILEVGDDHRKDAAYFTALTQQMENGGYQALLHYLLTLDLEGFNVRAAPRTDELRLQQMQSMRPEEGLLHALLCEGTLMPAHEGWEREAVSDLLIDRMLNEFSNEPGLTIHGARTRLALLFKRLFGLNGVRRFRKRNVTIQWLDSRGNERASANPWLWQFPSLKACRKAWEDEYGPEDWPTYDSVDAAGADEGEPF